MDLSDYKEKINTIDEDPSHRYKPKIIDLANFAPKYSSVIIVDPDHSEPEPKWSSPSIAITPIILTREIGSECNRIRMQSKLFLDVSLSHCT